MKTNIVLIAILALTISACSTTAKTPIAQEPTPGDNKTDAATSTSSTASVNANNLSAQLDDMQKSSVYFDYDDSSVKPEYRDLIQRQAEFIKNHHNVIVTLEGYADERGSSEYNLALGDRRATAVRKALQAMGVPGSRVKITSMGEKNPRLTCHEEKCWKENRRTDFTGKQGA